MRPSKGTSKTKEGEIVSVVRFRLEPTKEQEQKLFRTFYLCRKLYNHALEERIIIYRENGVSIRYTDQQNRLPVWKQSQPEYKEVHSQVLQNVLQRLDQAFINFFEKRTRFPRFKNKFRYRSITYPQARLGYFHKDGYVSLPKIGLVRMIAHQPFDPTAVKIINVKFHDGKWYANLTYATESVPLITNTNNAVGIDLGLLSLIATSDGDFFANPKWLQKSEKRLKRKQRQLSRKKKGSNNREKAKHHLQAIHDHVANQRKDHLHKVSRSLVNRYDLICMEDLLVKGMMKNHRLAKSIANAGWGRLATYIEYKAKFVGKRVVKVPPHYTSQLCSGGCGTIVKKDLSVRIHKCPKCGLEIDRDTNAAINILRRGLEILRQAG
ncbi:RNA-guided endonuclease InsQ/TnpB family protein [Alicyclobacillus dauci]|uniref:Transposase n=1 Tax=Alicyclobacillus dauci TaxID=1475485 RepID=A0ABY6Z2R7_9BACL|nr:RNA-guided endonuclease TnpB family protein [Alicyclobacillus dauci]WAH36813.1 transposase [Alicyclobacillus dauci]